MLRILAATLVMLALTACGGGGDEDVVPAAAPDQACSAGGARQTVRHVLSALEAGDVDALDRAFATPPVFRWYSTDGPAARLDAEARNRDTLRSYLESRSRENERLVLTSFGFDGRSGDYALFKARLTRSADDVVAMPFVVRGAISCGAQRGTVAAWAMARS